MNTRLLFLPGASGNTAFWEPVASRLAFSDKKWPPHAALPPKEALFILGRPGDKKNPP
ncbi:MAG: hypothetical protein M0Q54_01415 [Pigmentiphaga sp.]|nr:hypothetical protein [Pigmentiphaga sp.]